jgi:GH18 family chitinase
MELWLILSGIDIDWEYPKGKLIEIYPRRGRETHAILR